MKRIYERNEGRDAKAAKEIREKFYDRPVEKRLNIPWQWPRSMREVGLNMSVMYASDKWQKRRGSQEDYKHVSEGKQWILARPGFLRQYNQPERQVPVAGPMVDLGPMPDTFAVLADILGVQVRLYEQGGSEGFQLPEDPDDGYHQVVIPGAKLGASRFPDSGDAFLIVYTRAGVDLLIVGEQLDVEKDGIVGN